MTDFLTKFSDILFYLIFIILAFAIVKFIFLLIRYFIFKKFINFILDQIYEDSDNNNFNDFKSNKEDEVKKDLEQEKQKELEEKIEILNKKENNIDQETKIIGIAKKIYGPWTAKIVKGFMKNILQLNPEDLKKGYFQALILAEKRRKEIGKNSRF